MKKKLNFSPYVYPYIPFNILSNKIIKYKISGRQVITWKNISNYLTKVKTPIPKIKNLSVAENILDIFTNHHYLFGPKEYILSKKDFWLNKLNHFIKKNQPILFTILGFPFKVPVPLKTNRIYPDMGDVLALHRLYEINLLIKKIYKPGSLTYVFTEGPFGKFTNVPKKRIQNYMNFLQNILNKLNYNKYIQLLDLGNLEKEKGFKYEYNNEINSLTSLYIAHDQEYLKKFEGTYSSLYRIIGTEKYPEHILMDVYNDNLPDNQSISKVINIRKLIRKKAESAVIKYHAYLNIRDKFDFIDKTVPNSLPLSVSPKPGRLGIHPINKDNIRIPHHAVTVFKQKTKKFSLEYLIDIKRSTHTYSEIHLRGDKDPAPFFYIDQS